MPIYEYKCEECGARYEQLRRMSDADRELECPKCRSERVRRQLSTFATSAAGSAAADTPCGRPCGAGGFT